MGELESKSSRLQLRIETQGPAPSAVRDGAAPRTILLCLVSAVVASLVTIGFCFNRIDWDLIQQVHGTFWAALIVAPITLTGVFLTNNSHDRRATAQLAAEADKSDKQLLHDADRLAMQLDHAANEAQIARQLNMRREVYLEAAEEMVRANTFLGSMFNLDYEDPKALEGLAGYVSANAKVLMVSEPDVAYEALRLQTMVGKLALLATPAGVSASRIHAEAKLAEVRAARLGQKVQALEEEQQGVDADNASSRWMQLGQEIGRCRAAHIEALNVSADRFGSSAEARRNFVAFLRPHINEIGDQQVRVLARLRVELGFDADEEQMLAEAREVRCAIFAQVDSVLEGLGARTKVGAPDT
ncbi:hypothetical protein PGB34_03110 [Xenophilus arseniciresistens]|uniref:Uncharacterized protein n=1 Tax=Xenophilus arseniciresistens TaxID=1283306 RepID=A0AAE3N5Q1_9BURK|nr:hypothetical protein [Xenophilus arseniciresistens]MDA7415343.1 hypothetical protein [Xenophilus arseniciresistens]